MGTKIDTTSADTQRIQAGASASPAIKMSMFKRKPGFVIPKNKFSGSLVPIFRGGKKSESNGAAMEETSKQLQRKTKWGPDPTQDASVRKGRAVAYQTRVDQITQQLKSGSLGIESHNSESSRDGLGCELPNIQDVEKLQILELERREAIGEIMKLNPKYKAPSDYQPVVREATVPIPVKTHPDYNFLGLIYGSDGETQKRLEKETGTKIQVCGTKSKTKEKVEVTASDGSKLVSSYEEVHVRISSDTWEKVDAAAALIELLLSSVKSATSTSISRDKNVEGLSEAQDIATSHGINSAMANQKLQPGADSISMASQGPFQPYPRSSVGFTFSPPLTHPVLGPGSHAPFGFGSSHPNSAVPTPRLHTPAPVIPGSFMPSAYPVGQSGPLRNLSSVTSPSPLVGHQPTLAGSPRISSPQLAERPFHSTTPSGWVVPHAGAPQSLASGGFPSIGPSQGTSVSQPTAQFPPPQLGIGPASATSSMASQVRSSSPMPAQGSAQATLVQLLISTANNALRPSQNHLPPSSASHAPSFTPLSHARGPSHPGSGEFTFQPSRPQGAPSQSFQPSGLHFASQRPAPAPLPPAPQGPSFRPALQMRQNFPGPHTGNQMGARPGQFGPPNLNPHVGPRHLGLVSNAGAGSFTFTGGHPIPYQQKYPAPLPSQPASSIAANMSPTTSGRPQVYDPFSPTSLSSAARSQENNVGIVSKQETDAEYEDLMASVGVK